MKASLGLIALALAAAPATAQHMHFHAVPLPGIQYQRPYAGPMPIPVTLPVAAWRPPVYYPYAPVGPYFYPYPFGYMAPVGPSPMTNTEYAPGKGVDTYVTESYTYAAPVAAPSTTNTEYVLARSGNPFVANSYEYAPAVVAPMRESAPPLAPGTAMITLEVPADATVVFQGQATTQTGTRRQFVTPAMSGSGKYDVKVSWKNGDQAAEQELAIDVNPGDRRVVTVIANR